MIGFACLAIGIVICVVPINELRGYGNYQGNEKELDRPKRLKLIVSILLMLYGGIRWMATILNFLT